MKKKILQIEAIVFFGAFTLGFLLGSIAEYSLAHDYKVISEVYTVKQGDTFMDICLQYRKKDARDPYVFVYMDEIRELNPFLKETKNQLQPGDEIKIQYKE